MPGPEKQYPVSIRVRLTKEQLQKLDRLASNRSQWVRDRLDEAEDRGEVTKSDAS